MQSRRVLLEERLLHQELKLNSFRSQTVRRAMDHYKARYAEPQDNRGRNEGSPQRARRIEAPVTPKCDHDIPLQVGSVPACKAATDLRNHGDFEQATAGSAY